MGSKHKKLSQSELISETQYFDDITNLQMIMAIHRQSGTCFATASYNDGEEIQENLVSGFLTAITSFGTEIGDAIGKNNIVSKGKSVVYGDFTITILDGKELRLGIISTNTPGRIMKEKAIHLLEKYEREHSNDLSPFKGEMSLFEDFPQLVDKMLDGDLNKKNIINYNTLKEYDGPKKVRKVLKDMHKMDEEFYPGQLPYIFNREAGLSLTEAKFYAYDAYKCYIFNVADHAQKKKA